MFNYTKKIIWLCAPVFLVVFLTVFSPKSEAASARKAIQQGNALFEEGDFSASKQKYLSALEREPESGIVHFNLGTALYKEREYEEAVQHFQKVFLTEDVELKEKAYYNLGNTYYQQGHANEKQGNLENAISFLGKSLKQYERALAVNAGDEDAKHNLAFVQEEIKRLKQQQQQQQQTQGQKSGDSKNQQQESKKSSQDGQEQSGSSSSQEPQDQQGRQQGQPKEDSEGQEPKESQPDQSQSPDEGQEKVDQSGASRDTAGEKDLTNTQGQSQEASRLTTQEAQMLLESYQQGEEPQKQFNVLQQPTDGRPVLKDW